VHVLEATAPAAQLARHAIAGGLDESAAHFSVAAGDEAIRLFLARAAFDHYDRALGIAERSGWTSMLPDLHALRGKAYARMAKWPEARSDLQAALDGLGEDQQERRAEVLVDLLEVCWWLLDASSQRQWAREAVALAEDVGRGDLQLQARAWLAAGLGAAGDVSVYLGEAERALDRGRELGIPPPATVYSYLALSLYWLGRFEEAIQRGREGIAAGHTANHATATMFSMPHVGLALAGSGRYPDAMQVFEEARRFGREYGIAPLLARSIAMSAGLHLDVWDFEGNEVLAEEARELARSWAFGPPDVSAGLDLLLNFARRGDVGRADALVEEVAAAAVSPKGPMSYWHGWLWRLRLAEARAEIALARGNWQDSLTCADEAIERSRARRVKYEVLGLTTRAQALLGLGQAKAAIVELKRAVDIARPVGDPALFLRPAVRLIDLSIDGGDVLAAEARSAVERIDAALPDDTMRARFSESEPVRTLTRLTAVDSSNKPLDDGSRQACSVSRRQSPVARER
jgi:tetratricopeptide (TPR) repeat protein